MNMEFNAMIDPILEDEGQWNWILEFPDWMPEELKEFDKKFAVRMLSSVTEYEVNYNEFIVLYLLTMCCSTEFIVRFS